MKINNIDTVISTLKSKLVEYLALYNIDATNNKKVCCPNPKHNDLCASAAIIPNNPELLKCFGCEASYDIFHIASFFESLPIEGEDFIKVTIPTLAKKLGVEVEFAEVTEEEKYRQKTYEAYKEAAKYISEQPWNDSIANEIINKRKWNEKLIREEHVGCVGSFREFRNHLKSKEFDAAFLDDIDLGRSEMFNEDNLIFTIKDEYGKAVGFMARNLKYEEQKEEFEKNGGKKPSKYINSRTSTSPKCNIYQKSRRLYNIHKAKQWQPPLYIMEGQADVLSMMNNGIFNCCAVSGTAFTDDHIDLLIGLKIKEIILSFDGDNAGQNRTEVILKEKLSKYRNFNTKVLTIPEGLDPDDYVRKYGAESFLGLSLETPFEWLLKRYPDNTEYTKITEEMIPLIVGEASYLIREDLIKQLSGRTGYSLEAIKAEIDRVENEDSHLKADEFRNLGSWVASELKKSPSEIESILINGLDRATSIKESHESIDLFDFCLSGVEETKTAEESRLDTITALKFGPNLIEFQKLISGNWTDGHAFFIGAQANAGKTVLLSQIAADLARYNDDVITFVQTLDDSREQWEGKVLAHMAQNFLNEDKLVYATINKLRNPNFYTNKENIKVEGNKNLTYIRNKAYNQYQSLIQEKKLLILDAVGNKEGKGRCPDFKSAINILTQLRRSYPEKKIVWILDNFHDLPDVGTVSGADTERVRMKRMGKEFRTMLKRLKITCFASVEYTKMNPLERPVNKNISETAALEYAASMILHIHNPLHGYTQCGKGDLCAQFHNGETWMEKVGIEADKMPIVELIIGKNKITSIKNKILYFKMFPELATLKTISEAENNQIKINNQKAIKNSLENDETMNAKYIWNDEDEIQKLKKKYITAKG